MRLFRVLPVLALLLGAHASTRVLHSAEPAPHRVEERQIGTNVCLPVKIPGTILTLLPLGFAYLTHGSGAGGLTFSFLRLSVFVFLSDSQCASVCRPFQARLPSRLPNTCTNLRPSQLTNLKTHS